MKDFYNELQANLKAEGFNPQFAANIVDEICNDEIFDTFCPQSHKNEVYQDRMKVILKAIKKTLNQ